MSFPPPYTESTSTATAVVGSDSSDGDNPQVAWWCKILVRTAAAIAGGVCIGMGAWRCISISPLCIVAGIIQILLGCMVLLFEVPFCCQHFQLTRPISNFAEKRTYFQKAILFAGMAIIPAAMCFSASTIIGCGLVFSVGVIYGLMALGKKADRETMLSRAGQDDKAAIVPNIVIEH